MTTTTIITSCDVAAYRAWATRSVTPAYMRGLPTWVWQSALRSRCADPSPRSTP